MGKLIFSDSRVGNALKKTTLLRSAEMEGVETSTDIYPLSNGAAARLAQMLTDLLFSHLDSP